MRIAGHTLGTPHHDLPAALRLFAAAGLDAAEVIYQDDYPAALPLGNGVAAERARRIADSEGVPIVALTPYTKAFNSLDAAERQGAVDELRGAIDIAATVGADRLRIYAGAWQPDQADHAAHWGALAASLAELADVAWAAGVWLCVENHFGTMTQSARETAQLVRELDHPAIAVLYDQANLTFTHDEPYHEALEIQGDLLGHVHVKDLVFTDPRAPFRASHTERVLPQERAVRSKVVGEGVVPWPEVLRALVDLGYDDVLSLEYEYRWHPQDLPPPEVGFARSAAVLRAELATLALKESTS